MIALAFWQKVAMDHSDNGLALFYCVFSGWMDACLHAFAVAPEGPH
jgi:hypothetical protein